MASFCAGGRAAACWTMSSSRTVSRTGAEAVVEQKGSAALGPFRQRFTVLLAVREEMNQSISASGIDGDFRCFKSRYEIVPLGLQRARIVYQATLVPGMPIPPIIGLLAMRSMPRDDGGNAVSVFLIFDGVIDLRTGNPIGWHHGLQQRYSTIVAPNIIQFIGRE